MDMVLAADAVGHTSIRDNEAASI